MKRFAIAAAVALFGLGGIALGIGLGVADRDDGVVVIQGTGEPGDPCADYVNEGLACEYLAFPEMEIRAGEGQELAGALVH